MSTEPSCAGLNPSAARPAFSSLDLLPTVDSWAVRSGPPVSVALAGPVGFQVSAPKRGSVARSVVAYDFLDPTFYFSFVGPSLVGNLLHRVKRDSGIQRGPSPGSATKR
jgi:hypothetical protein